MKTYLGLIAVAATLSGFSPASGGTFEAALPGLVGSYGTGRTAAFNFGVSFVEIDDVGIRMAGTITPGIGHGDGVLRSADDWFSWPSQIGVVMDPPGSGLWYAYIGPYNGAFEIEKPFESFLNPTWEFLLDGRGEVEAYLAPLIILGGVMVQPPRASISEASLIVHGEVPEPTSLVLLALGALRLLIGGRSASCYFGRGLG